MNLLRFICVTVISLLLSNFTLGQPHKIMKYFEPEHQNNIIGEEINKTYFNIKYPHLQKDIHNPNAGLLIQKCNNLKKQQQLTSTKYRPQQVMLDDTIRITYTYDNNGNELTSLEEQWTNNAWVNASRYTYTYDTNGNRLTELREDWRYNAWVNDSRWTNTYDTNGNRLTGLYELFGNTWLNDYRLTYTYDTNGNTLTGLWESFGNNTWYIYSGSRYTYTYDNNGNTLTQMSERWTNNAWVYNVKYTYTYDNNGNPLTWLWENWTDNAWVNSYRYTYTNDNNGNPLREFHERWAGYWKPSSQYIYTYDNNGNPLTKLDEEWATGWVDNVRWTYTYDNNGNAIHAEFWWWGNNNWAAGNGILYLNYNNRSDGLSFTAHIADVTYTSFTDVKDNGTALNSFTLEQNYPNPFNPNTTINYQLPKSGLVTIKVYDILGNEIKTLVNEYKPSGDYTVNFDASKLSSGVYIYRVVAGDYVASKKMTLIK